MENSHHWDVTAILFLHWNSCLIPLMYSLPNKTEEAALSSYLFPLVCFCTYDLECMSHLRRQYVYLFFCFLASVFFFISSPSSLVRLWGYWSFSKCTLLTVYLTGNGIVVSCTSMFIICKTLTNSQSFMGHLILPIMHAHTHTVKGKVIFSFFHKFIVHG